MYNMSVLSLASTRQLFDNFVAATLETSKGLLMNLIITMKFMKSPLRFQVLLQQSCQKVA